MAMPAELTDPNRDEGGSPELSVDQLQAQLAAEREIRQRAESNLDHERGRLDAFLSKGNEETKPQALEPIGAPPDMIENPDAYRAWVVEKDRRAQIELDHRLETQRDEMRSEIASAESRASLWQTFQANHPAHAKLESIAGHAFRELSSAGGLPSDSPSIAKAIADKMDSMVGASISGMKTDATRTAGTSGGETGPTQTADTSSEEDGQVTMHSAISEFQKKHGLI